MSKGRMKDLQDALQAAGWRLLDAKEYPRATANPFMLENERVIWGIASPDQDVRELEFHAFSDLGQRTEQLRDILYCVDVRTGEKLYFDKRESANWKGNLSRFVNRIKNPK